MERYTVDIAEIQIEALNTILNLAGSDASLDNKIIAIKATAENCHAMTDWIRKEGKKANGK